jgi:hypothetical protein
MRYFEAFKGFANMYYFNKISLNGIGIALLAFISFSTQAQVWDVQIGSNMTHYDFINTAGSHVISIKPVTGFHMQTGYQYIDIDSSGSSKGILTFGVHLNYNEFNAMGTMGPNLFNYETNFLGLDLNGGINIPLFSGFSIRGLLHISANKLIYGYQMVNNDYHDLTEAPQFNDIQILNGYSLQVNKRVNPFIQIHVGYKKSDSIFIKPFNGTSLSFEPATLLVGINFLVQKKPKKVSL